MTVRHAALTVFVVFAALLNASGARAQSGPTPEAVAPSLITEGLMEAAQSQAASPSSSA